MSPDSMEKPGRFLLFCIRSQGAPAETSVSNVMPQATLIQYMIPEVYLLWHY